MTAIKLMFSKYNVHHLSCWVSMLTCANYIKSGNCEAFSQQIFDLMTLTSVPVNHDSVRMSPHAQYQEPEAAKWNSVIVHFSTNTCVFPTVRVKMTKVTSVRQVLWNCNMLLCTYYSLKLIILLYFTY